ncbi:uncharacterized protein [Typha angustifolia]|uniref:uncharacterized protein n=1 Tax=Typha angustifolia TaxID=59011 RepID=UPI003C2C0EA0
MAAVVNETPSILARVDRLDIMLSFLEETKGNRSAARSPTSASTTPSHSMTASDEGNSSANSSPKSFSRRRLCQPMHDVVTETRAKGNLIHRIDLLESRILKLEEEMEHEKRAGGEERSPRSGEKRERGKGLRRLVKSCMNGGFETNK